MKYKCTDLAFDADNRNANLIKQTMPSNFCDNSYPWDGLGKNVEL
jgi:hypothetical protein